MIEIIIDSATNNYHVLRLQFGSLSSRNRFIKDIKKFINLEEYKTRFKPNYYEKIYINRDRDTFLKYCPEKIDWYSIKEKWDVIFYCVQEHHQTRVEMMKCLVDNINRVSSNGDYHFASNHEFRTWQGHNLIMKTGSSYVLPGKIEEKED